MKKKAEMQRTSMTVSKSGDWVDKRPPIIPRTEPPAKTEMLTREPEVLNAARTGA
jgi:hypothetical protein